MGDKFFEQRVDINILIKLVKNDTFTKCCTFMDMKQCVEGMGMG